MKIFLSSLLCITIALSYQRVSAENVLDYVQYCLAESGLNISVFGVTDVKYIEEESFKKLEDVAADKRGCFIACVYNKQGEIIKDGVLQEDLPPPDESAERIHENNFDEAIKECKAEKDFCKLGNCLYNVYF